MENEPKSCFQRLLEHKWFVLFMWQVCSVLLCAMNVCCTLLVNESNETLPFLQLTVAYALLSIGHGWRWRKSEVQWWRYFIVAVLNCAGDGFSVISYNTTSLSSSMLLVTTVIFWVVPLSYLAFKRKFSVWQIVSLFLGMTGIVCVFIADRNDGPSKWLGNMFAVMSAMSFACSTVLQEMLVHSASTAIYLSRFSLFALGVSGAITGGYEWKSIRDFAWKWQSYLIILGYGLTQAIYYSIVPLIMQHSSATEMNMSFLTSNFFSLLLSILCFGQKASWLYLAGFVCIPAAIAMFSLLPPKQDSLSISNVGDDCVAVSSIPLTQSEPVSAIVNFLYA